MVSIEVGDTKIKGNGTTGINENKNFWGGIVVKSGVV